MVLVFGRREHRLIAGRYDGIFLNDAPTRSLHDVGDYDYD
jgi:hypothetical protein